MSEQEQHELSPELRALLQDGRPGNEVPPGEREALLRSLSPFLGPVGGGSDGGGAPSPAPHGIESAPAAARAITASKLTFGVGGLLVGIVAGAAGHALMTEPNAPPPSPPAVVMAPAATTQPDMPTPVEALPLASAPAPESSVERAPPSIPSARAAASLAPAAGEASGAPHRDDALRTERRLLDIARTAVARGDGNAALDAIGRHAAQFPRGRLAEEREALRVQALILLGRKDEARQKADEFRKQHPDSLMMPGIDPAL